MKNLYQNKNILPESLDHKSVKSVWKRNKKHSSALNMLYIFLTKKDLEKSIDRAFSPLIKNGNKVIKSYCFPKVAQYQALLLLISGMEQYSKSKGFFNNSIIKGLKYNNRRNITIEEDKVYNELEFVFSRISMTENQFLKLYGLICSYYLHINDQRRLFQYKNIDFYNNVSRKKRNCILKKLNSSPKGSAVRGMAQFILLMSKLGNTEYRILKSYNKRKENYNNDQYLQAHKIYKYKKKLEGIFKREALFYHKPDFITKSKLQTYSIPVNEKVNRYNKKIFDLKGLIQHLISVDECGGDIIYSDMISKNKSITLLALFIVIMESEN